MLGWNEEVWKSCLRDKYLCDDCCQVLGICSCQYMSELLVETSSARGVWQGIFVKAFEIIIQRLKQTFLRNCGKLIDPHVLNRETACDSIVGIFPNFF